MRVWWGALLNMPDRANLRPDRDVLVVRFMGLTAWIKAFLAALPGKPVRLGARDDAGAEPGTLTRP